MHRLLPLLIVLTGCQSLLGEQGLEQLIGQEPIPVDLAWELRWYRGEGAGLLVGCETVAVGGDLGLDGVPFGFLDVPPPDAVPAPPVSIPVDESTWSLALPVLLDRTAGTPRPSAEQPWLGAWGAPPWSGLLQVEGDAAAVSKALGLTDEEADLAPGLHVVDLFVEEIVAQGSFDGALFVVPEDLEYIPVVEVEELEGAERDLFGGIGLGGLEFEPCP